MSRVLRWLERLDDRHPGVLAVGYLMLVCAGTAVGMYFGGV